MPVTLVLDQGVPCDAARRLRDLGYECVHVGEAGIDADFHAILAVSGAAGPSVIRIRIQGLRAAEIAECVRLVSTRFESELTAGSLLTVKSRKTTCHSLPIGPSR